MKITYLNEGAFKRYDERIQPQTKDELVASGKKLAKRFAEDYAKSTIMKEIIVPIFKKVLDRAYGCFDAKTSWKYPLGTSGRNLGDTYDSFNISSEVLGLTDDTIPGVELMPAENNALKVLIPVVLPNESTMAVGLDIFEHWHDNIIKIRNVLDKRFNKAKTKEYSTVFEILNAKSFDVKYYFCDSINVKTFKISMPEHIEYVEQVHKWMNALNDSTISCDTLSLNMVQSMVLDNKDPLDLGLFVPLLKYAKNYNKVKIEIHSRGDKKNVKVSNAKQLIQSLPPCEYVQLAETTDKSILDSFFMDFIGLDFSQVLLKNGIAGKTNYRRIFSIKFSPTITADNPDMKILFFG